MYRASPVSSNSVPLRSRGACAVGTPPSHTRSGSRTHQQHVSRSCVLPTNNSHRQLSSIGRVPHSASTQTSREACTLTASEVASAPTQHRPAGSKDLSPLPTSLNGIGGDSWWHSAHTVVSSPSKRASSPGNEGNNIIPVAAATAAAATKSLHYGDCRTGQAVSKLQQQHETDLQQQTAHAEAAADPTLHRVWLPEKQLWVPRNARSSSSSCSSSLSSSPAAAVGPASSSGGEARLQRVFMAAAATKGRKQAMEDRHVLAALDPSHGVQAARGAVGLQQQVSVAAVFDGHAGYATAAYAAQHIPHLLHEALSGRPGKTEGGPRVPQRELLNPSSALAASFHWFDRWWADARCDPAFTEHGWDDSGSTAVVGLVSGQQLIVANAGDSIALLARGGASQRLSVEHRLDNAEEAERVLGAGGRVVAFKPGAKPRVMGNSNQTRFKGSMVTRSLGDFAFKYPQALISADPHVAQQELAPCDKLVVLTSDGVTDVLPDDDMLELAICAIEQTQQCTNSGQALAKAAAVAIMNAAMDSGSTDNITVVAMLLDWGGEYATD